MYERSTGFLLTSMFVFQRLLKLKSDGTELVTNVQVAGDARENVRRVDEEENKRQRFGMFCSPLASVHFWGKLMMAPLQSLPP